jgi:hypothetical protein
MDVVKANIEYQKNHTMIANFIGINIWDKHQDY